MSFEGLFKVLGDIAMADGLTYGIAGALALIAFVLMHAMLPAKGLAYVFAPFMLWGSLVGVHVASIAGFAASTERAVNVAAGAALGMIAALVVMVMLARLAEAALRIRTPLAYTIPADRRPRS